MIDCFGREILVQEIRSDRFVVIGIGGCDAEFCSAFCSDSRVPHALGNRVSAALDSSFDEFTMHPWTPVGVKVFLRSDFVDDGYDLSLLCFGLGNRAVNKLIVSRSCDLQDSTKHRDRPATTMLVDEPQSQLLSLAKKVVAFFKISRSILS